MQPTAAFRILTFKFGPPRTSAKLCLRHVRLSVRVCVCVCGSAGGRTVRPTGFPSEFLVLFTDNFKVFVAMPGDQFLLCALFTRSRRNLVAGCSYPETKRTSVAFVQRKRKRAENYNKWHNNFIFLNCNQHFGNFKPQHSFRVLFDKTASVYFI